MSNGYKMNILYHIRIHYNIYSQKVKLFLKNAINRQLFQQLWHLFYVNLHSKYTPFRRNLTQHLVVIRQIVYIKRHIRQPVLFARFPGLWQPFWAGKTVFSPGD